MRTVILILIVLAAIFYTCSIKIQSHGFSLAIDNNKIDTVYITIDSNDIVIIDTIP